MRAAGHVGASLDSGARVPGAGSRSGHFLVVGPRMHCCYLFILKYTCYRRSLQAPSVQLTQTFPNGTNPCNQHLA